MTTRRRQTGFEAGSEQPFLNKTTTIIQVPQENSWAQVSPDFFPSTQPLVDSFYKKTDISASPVPTNYPGSTSTNNHIPQAIPLLCNKGILSNSNSEELSFNSNNLDSSNDLCDIMASRDRTQEFSRIIRSQQGNLANGVHHLQEGKKTKDFRHYAEFMQRSKRIGRNISSTYAKLEKLTLLAKKRSLFDDYQDQEVQELTGIIGHDLSSLTKQLQDLQARSKATNSLPSGTTGHLQKHSINLVSSLQSKVTTIAQQFKDVLEVRTVSLKKQAERRGEFAGGISTGALPPQAFSGYHQGSVLLADEAAAAARGRSQDSKVTAIIDMDNLDVTDSGFEGAVGGGGGGGGKGTTVYQQQLQLMEEQDAYMQSRADTMKTIESTIVDLGQMFTQLATLVQEQEELVHRIDSNVDETGLNVEGAHTELLKYFKNISSNRWLMAKVFGIVVVFFVIFVVFMA